MTEQRGVVCGAGGTRCANCSVVFIGKTPSNDNPDYFIEPCPLCRWWHQEARFIGDDNSKFKGEVSSR